MGTPHEKNIQKQIERDMAILSYLAGGLSTVRSLRKGCFADRGIAISRQVLERRLNKLSRMGHLVKGNYRTLRKALTVYALSEAGRTEVSERSAIDPDSVRCGLCRAHHLLHEIALGEVARRVIREARANLYTISLMHDDKVLRRDEKARKGVYYPDLKLEIVTRSLARRTYNIEVDAGVKGKTYWLAKLSSWSGPSLVLVANPSRLHPLGEMLRSRLRSKDILLSTVDLFVRDGLADTQWYSLADPQKTAKLNLR